MSGEEHSREASDDTSCTDCATLLSNLASKTKRSCAGQLALVSTPLVGPWKFAAADRSGHSHLYPLRVANVDEHYVDANSLVDRRRRFASFFDYDGRAAEACTPKSRRKRRMDDRSHRIPAEDDQISSVLKRETQKSDPVRNPQTERRR